MAEVNDEGLRDDLAGGPGPDPDWVEQMVAKGQKVRLELGQTGREDKVMLEDGTPIRGVVRVTIEDDALNGRVVTIRLRNVEVEAPVIDLTALSTEEIAE